MDTYLQEGIDTLRRAFGQGITLIPASGKKPVRRGWNKLTAADMTVAYFAIFPGGNIGLVCGRNSGHICALDIDSDDGLSKFLDAYPEARKWPTVRGQRGAKLFVRIPGSYPSKHKLVTAAGENWGDWLADGAYAIVWGVHPDSGQPYEWEGLAPVPELPFTEILHVLTRLGVCKKGGVRPKPSPTPPHNTQSTTSSSATCNLHPVPCTLYDTGPVHGTNHADDVVATIRAREAMQEAAASHFGDLGGLFEQYIERRFEAAAGHRNGFIVEAVPFLLRCVGPDVAIGLAMLFYDTHQHLFKGPRDRHEHEVRAMVEGAEQSYRAELSDSERKVFEVLSPVAKAAFRICRDLALRQTSARPPLTFFLASDNLAARLQIHGRQAHRLLERFDNLIIERVEKGQRWQSGKKAQATTYRWILETAT